MCTQKIGILSFVLFIGASSFAQEYQFENYPKALNFIPTSGICTEDQDNLQIKKNRGIEIHEKVPSPERRRVISHFNPSERPETDLKRFVMRLNSIHTNESSVSIANISFFAYWVDDLNSRFTPFIFSHSMRAKSDHDSMLKIFKRNFSKTGSYLLWGRSDVSEDVEIEKTETGHLLTLTRFNPCARNYKLSCKWKIKLVP